MRGNAFLEWMKEKLGAHGTATRSEFQSQTGSDLSILVTDTSANELRVLSRVKRLANTTSDAHDQRIIEAHPDLVCRPPAKGSLKRFQRLLSRGKPIPPIPRPATMTDISHTNLYLMTRNNQRSSTGW